MKDTTSDILNAIPDFSSWQAASDWISQGQEVLKRSSERLLEQQITWLSWDDIAQKQTSPWGFYGCEKWRKFVLAAFLADLASYPNPTDQVTFERLAFVMHLFPQGFKTAWIKLTDEKLWPVGYTGWYLMQEQVFEVFEKSPELIKDRTVVPCVQEGKNGFLYLFNYSVAPVFRKSSVSKQLVRDYVEEIHTQNPRGLACITVSDEGASVAKRFGMSCTGALTIDGQLESIYVKRF